MKKAGNVWCGAVRRRKGHARHATGLAGEVVDPGPSGHCLARMVKPDRVTNAKSLYLLWRSGDQHGAGLDILRQKGRDKAAATRFSGVCVPPRALRHRATS
jgi:hypothetical protein